MRSPDVDVPIRTFSGDPSPSAAGSLWSFLFGSTTPFTTEKLMNLYPTHDDYVSKVKEAALQAKERGFLLEPEAQGFIEEAVKTAVPK